MTIDTTIATINVDVKGSLPSSTTIVIVQAAQISIPVVAFISSQIQ
jgi:hypothetical protein